jgi:hypothetical protein
MCADTEKMWNSQQLEYSVTLFACNSSLVTIKQS